MRVNHEWIERVIAACPAEPARSRAPGLRFEGKAAGPRRYQYGRLDLKGWLLAHGAELTADEWESDRYFVRCPWEEEHSESQERLTDTFIRDGTGKKYPVPFFHCSHSHSGCQDAGHGKHDLDALAAEWGDAEQFGASARADGGWPLTDVGNAERLAARFEARVRYCHDRETWLIWTDTHWAVDGDGGILRLAKEVTRGLLEEVQKLPEEERKPLYAHFLKSESERGMNGMVRLARAELPLPSEKLDNYPWLLNFSNGTLDLETMTLGEQRREDYLTQCLGYAYDPEAACPHWEQFIQTVTRSEELARYLQKAVGYSLSGSVREKCLFMLEGPTDSGKTTFLETLGAILREGGYGTKVPAEMLLAKKDGGIPSDLAQCAGKRFVWTSETDDNRRLATGLIKAITGRDRISARRMYRDWFDFTATFKLWFATNHKPVIREHGDAIWNRIRYVPFAYTCPRAQQDRDLADKLRREIPGIINWAVQGCRLWLAEGLTPPALMEEALGTYRREMDLIKQWLEELCVREVEGLTQCQPLYVSYAEWCKRSGEVPFPIRRFAAALGETFEREERRHKLYFRGLRLMTSLEAQGIGPKG